MTSKAVLQLKQEDVCQQKMLFYKDIIQTRKLQYFLVIFIEIWNFVLESNLLSVNILSFSLIIHDYPFVAEFNIRVVSIKETIAN